jgi:hypothetical protein
MGVLRNNRLSLLSVLALRVIFIMVMRVESNVYPLNLSASVLKEVSHDPARRVKGVEIILYKPRLCDII